MESKFTQNMMVLLSHCDSTKRLSIPSMFSIFMDAATLHAEQLGIGSDTLGPKGLFWVAVRTRLRIYERPEMMDNITVCTWPEVAGKIRCNRDYLVTMGDKRLIEGKTEWAIIELDSGKPYRMQQIYPDGFEFCSELVIPEPFERMNDMCAECTLFATHRVTAADLDFGGHMNNAAYIRALMSSFSSEEWQSLNITDIEIAYKNQCYEGDVIELRRKTVDKTTYITMGGSDGKISALIKIL